MTPEDAFGADYSVHELESAISDLELQVKSQEGREKLTLEAERIIEAQRRLYALTWSLGLVLKGAAA